MGSIERTDLYQAGGYLAVLLAAIVILILTAVFAHILVRAIHHMLDRTTGGEVGGSIFKNIIRVIVWILGISTVLSLCVGFDASVLWGALGIGGIALSLGLQNTISSLIGGFQISLSRDIAIGDWVTIGTMHGEVKDITWRVMKVHDRLGNDHVIPNSVLNTTPVTVMPPWQRVVFPLVFSRGADLDLIADKVPQIAFDALGQADLRHGDMMPLLSIGGTAVDAIDASLIVYAHRRCTIAQISTATLPSVIEYLRDIDALAICGV
jgi:small-conductance mechanosensitive channel